MKKAFLLFVTILGFIANIQAQSKVTGIAQDAEGNPLEFANVMLLQLADSAVVALEMTETNGKFSMKDVEDGTYLLQIEAMGYASHSSEEVKVEGDTDLGVISIQKSDIELTEVVVKYKKPALEQKGGTLIVNVASSILANSGSAENVLKKVPGIMIVNGRITMAGRPGVNIMIDGRPTQYLDLESLLKDLPSDAIEKIEVMSQPDARFDAQGDAGIINIVLKKNIKLGLNGNAYVGAGYGDVWRSRAGVSLNYRNEKWNFSNFVGLYRNSSIDYMLIRRQVGEDVYTQKTQDPYKPIGMYVKTGADYYIDQRQTIGTSLKLWGGINDKVDNNITTIEDGATGNINATWNTTNELYRKTGFVSTDTYYQFEIDTSGQKLSADFGYYHQGRQADNNISATTEEGTDNEFRQQSKPSLSDIWAAKVDYTKPLSKEFKLDAGLKYSHARIDNDLQASVLENGTYVNDASLSNHFIYTEDLRAAYVKMTYSLKEMTVEAGVRFEDTDARGYSVTLDSTTRNDIRRFFPSVSVSGPLAGPLGWVTSYSHRINRPSFGELNPFVYYIDPFTTERGNPVLKPELTHSAKFSLTYEKQPFFNLEYRRTKDEIQLLTEQDAEGIAAGYSDNLNDFERYGISLFFPLDFVEGLSGFGGTMVNYDRYSTPDGNSVFDQAVWNATAFLNASYSFNDNLSMELNGWYASKSIEGVMLSKPLWGMDAGVQYKFLDGKARLNLSVDNILYKPWRADINFNGLNAYVQSDWEHPVANLRFTYSFGNKHLKQNDNRAGSTSDEQNRNK